MADLLGKYVWDKEHGIAPESIDVMNNIVTVLIRGEVPSRKISIGGVYYGEYVFGINVTMPNNYAPTEGYPKVYLGDGTSTIVPESATLVSEGVNQLIYAYGSKTNFVLYPSFKTSSSISYRIDWTEEAHDIVVIDATGATLLPESDAAETDGSMSNKALQALFELYGDRIFTIYLDNNRSILIDYPSSPKLSDITFETVGGVDYISIRHSQTMNGLTITYSIKHLTSTVQYVGIMDEDSKDYRVDVRSFK